MRLLDRVVGVFFVLFGLGLLVATVHLGMHQDSVVFATPRNWRAVFGGMVMGLGFCAGGLYIWRLDNPPTTTHFTEFLRTHRRQITLFAWIGSAVSLIRFAAACFGADWPGWWVEGPLAIGLGALFYGSREGANQDLTTLRKWPRLTKKTEGAVLMIYMLVFAAAHWYPMLPPRSALQQLSGITRIVFAGPWRFSMP